MALSSLKPWLPERAIEKEAARTLIESHFAQLAPAKVESLGEGWDNTVFLVNGEWVFRFPRRQIAVPCLEAEQRILPKLPPLPLPFPRPELWGSPSDGFPWPFAGYRVLKGRTAEKAALTGEQRLRAARPLGEFLKALHAVPPGFAGPDRFSRLDAAKMRRQTGDRLRDLGVPVPDFFDAPVRAPRTGTLVHGDMHARQILVDESGAVSGIIDWGDVHDGDPACDLAVAHGFLPPKARAAFREAYGPIDEGTWALARLRALSLGAALGVYAKSIDDDALLTEALLALDLACTS